MAQTGWQRSLTVEVTKKINDVVQPDYPIIYQGVESFVCNEVNYPFIDGFEMASMPEGKFQQRVTAFKEYVESKERGLHFDTDLQDGCDARRKNEGECQNEGECPINNYNNE